MSFSDLWRPLDADEMVDFARAWLAELRGEVPPEEAGIGQSVVMMNFIAPADQQWEFILAAVAHAESDDELGHIAAGPIEHLLGTHGDAYINLVEREAVTDGKFARTMSGVWKHMMSDEVWSRVQAIKERASGASEPPSSGASDA